MPHRFQCHTKSYMQCSFTKLEARTLLSTFTIPFKSMDSNISIVSPLNVGLIGYNTKNENIPRLQNLNQKPLARHMLDLMRVGLHQCSRPKNLQKLSGPHGREQNLGSKEFTLGFGSKVREKKLNWYQLGITSHQLSLVFIE